MSKVTITVTRECKRKGILRAIEGMLHSDELENGCIFIVRRKKTGKGIQQLKLFVSRLYRSRPPVEVLNFPDYTTTDYENREMIRWIGEHAAALVRMSIL